MAWCKRRREREEEPEQWKRKKVSLGQQEQPRRINWPEDIAYQELVSPAEELSPSLLAAKVSLLRSVLARAEKLAESLEELPQPPPSDGTFTLAQAETQELKQALSSPPHWQFGVSGLLTKDAQSLLSGNWVADEVVNEYAKLLTREGELPVASSYVFELLRDMRRAKKYDVGKVEQALEKSGLPSDCAQFAVPICWNDAHWSCALICHSQERIVHYDTHGSERPEAFELLQWLAQNLYLDETPFAECSKALPGCAAEDSGPAMLYALRCLSTGRTPEWTRSALGSIRELLALEIKRASLLAT